MTYFIFFTFIINILWFGSAFIFFGLRPKHAAMVIRPDIPAADEKTVLAIATMPFLGGMNLALAFLSAISLFYLSFYSLPILVKVVALSSSLAHATQFFFNFPNLKANGNWEVLKGSMLFIFIMDAFCMLLNLILWALIF